MAVNTRWPFRGHKGRIQLSIKSATDEKELIPGYVDGFGNTVFTDVYALIIGNRSASACNVTIRDIVTGAPVAIIPVPANDTRIIDLEKDSGIEQKTANSQWTAQCSASVDSIEITALFKRNT